MAPAIPIIIAVVSTAASVYSSISSSQAQAHAEHKQERLIQNEAEQARIANEQKAMDYKRRAVAALGTERSQRGASGIGMAGSPLLTYYENAKIFEEDMERIRRGGEVQQEGLMQRASLHRAYGKAAKEAGYWNTGQTILTGASNVFSEGRKVGWW